MSDRNTFINYNSIGGNWIKYCARNHTTIINFQWTHRDKRMKCTREKKCMHAFSCWIQKSDVLHAFIYRLLLHLIRHVKKIPCECPFKRLSAINTLHCLMQQKTVEWKQKKMSKIRDKFVCVAWGKNRKPKQFFAFSRYKFNSHCYCIKWLGRKYVWHLCSSLAGCRFHWPLTFEHLTKISRKKWGTPHPCVDAQCACMARVGDIFMSKSHKEMLLIFGGTNNLRSIGNASLCHSQMSMQAISVFHLFEYDIHKVKKNSNCQSIQQAH